jgi:hypothetical protein
MVWHGVARRDRTSSAICLRELPVRADVERPARVSRPNTVAMLSDLNDSLRRLLHERGLIEPAQVDVQFEAPVQSWIDTLIRPTLNLFLFGIEENTELRQVARQTTRGNGHATHRVPPRRFDVRYLVSAFTTDVADEQLLLWRALVTLLQHRTLPAEVLSTTLGAIEPELVTSVGSTDDGPRALDLWGALEMRPRPALIYTVTVPLDLDFAIVSPLVLTGRTRFAYPGAVETELRTHIGGIVRGVSGERIPGAMVSVQGRSGIGARTNEHGEFRLTHVPSGRVTLEVARDDGEPTLVPFEIPSDSYDVVLK